MDLFKKFCAEFIGTFVLVFVACGAAAALGCDKNEVNAAYALTALAFGLVIVAMAYSIGNVSGCHINPAVSLGVLISGGINIKEFIVYIIAQFAGATAGAGILSIFVGTGSGLGANSLMGATDQWIGAWKGSMLIEAGLTFIFVLVILSVTSKKEYSNVAGLIIGFTLTLVHIFGIHFTGTSVNPARSFGPAVFVGGNALASVWVFIVAPLIGAAVAALVFRFLIKGKKAEA